MSQEPQQTAGLPRIARPTASPGPNPVSHSDYLDQSATRFQTGRSVSRRVDIACDGISAVLLVVALLLPWNLYLGLGVPGTNAWVFAVLVVVTVLALGAVGAGFVRRESASPRLRLVLAAPDLVFVLAVLGFAVVQTVRSGGGTTVPPGIGPGVWAGVAGAILSARPAASGAADVRWLPWVKGTRIIGIVSMVLAGLFTLFNQYWRIQHAFSTSDGFSGRDLAVIASIIVYGVVALAVVVVCSRWLLQDQQAARLAVTVLGTAGVVAGIVVWILPIGRDLDAFHGIAQTTATMSVGFEGYLTWAAAAAVFVPLTLYALFTADAGTTDAWRKPARKLLLLIAFWCAAAVALRVVDLIVATMLDLTYSSYPSLTLLLFDVVAAALAGWLYRHLDDESVAANRLSAVCGAVFVLTICRIILAVVLAPRYVYLESPSPTDRPVFGNDLAQQFTSTFDVTVIGVALAVLAIVVLAGRTSGVAVPEPAPQTATPPPAITSWSNRPDAAPQTTAALPAIYRDPAGTQQVPAPAADTTQHPPRIHRALQESSQRFAAGTTYGGPTQSRQDASSDDE